MMAFLASSAAALSSTEQAAIGQTRDAMCRAVVREMHIEIHKHSLKKNGEDDIYETVPAICLAIVQNYSLTATPAPSSSWTLMKRTKKLDDAAEDGEMDPDSFKHIMTLKKACESFTDDLQQELSELMYKETYRKDPESIIDEFCSMPSVKKSYKPEKKGKKRKPGEVPPKAKPKKEKPKGQNDPPPSMDEMLKKYDTDGSISNLIEMERENPEAMLDPEDLAKVQRGSEQVRCDVCRAVAKVTLQRAKKARALRDEDKLSEIVGDVCVGTPISKDGLTYANNEYPKYPGNPPLWGEMYSVKEESGGFRLRKLPKGKPIEEKRGGDFDYNYMVIKHSMISRACKAVVSEIEPDLAEIIFSSKSEWTATSLGDAYCAGECSAGAKDEL